MTVEPREIEGGQQASGGAAGKLEHEHDIPIDCKIRNPRHPAIEKQAEATRPAKTPQSSYWCCIGHLSSTDPPVILDLELGVGVDWNPRFRK